jgi:hypothetical protein
VGNDLYDRLVEEANRQGFDPSRIERSLPVPVPS